MAHVRIYELGIVVSARESDDDVQGIVKRFRELIEGAGASVEVDDWGKRKLAYPIKKQTEGRYVFLYVKSEASVPWTDVERLLQQDERVLRHLVVRTDLDHKRAETKAKRRKTAPRKPMAAHAE